MKKIDYRISGSDFSIVASRALKKWRKEQVKGRKLNAVSLTIEKYGVQNKIRGD
jgi:hypothetical protein